MSRKRCLVKQADIARALRAAKQVGVSVAVKVGSDGSLTIIPAQESQTKAVAYTKEIVL